jgi:hypothetical protein
MYGYEARDDKAVLSDWDECVSRATTDGVHLESLHIQALVCILRRPIIIYGDRFGAYLSVNSRQSASSAPQKNSFSPTQTWHSEKGKSPGQPDTHPVGVYLPIDMAKAYSCSKVPLCLAYSLVVTGCGATGHYTAVVYRDGQQDRVAPLTDPVTGELLPVRYASNQAPPPPPPPPIEGALRPTAEEEESAAEQLQVATEAALEEARQTRKIDIKLMEAFLHVKKFRSGSGPLVTRSNLCSTDGGGGGDDSGGVHEIGVFAEIPFPTYFLPAAAALRAKHVQHLALQSQSAVPLSGERTVSGPDAHTSGPSVELSAMELSRDLAPSDPTQIGTQRPAGVWPELPLSLPQPPQQSSHQEPLSMFSGDAFNSVPPGAPLVMNGGELERQPQSEQSGGDDFAHGNGEMLFDVADDAQYQADLEHALRLSMEASTDSAAASSGVPYADCDC